MRIILLGGPGAGKGTQSAYIVNTHDIPQISTGDMLRTAIKEGSEIGQTAKAVIDAGELVSDDIIIDLVKQRIQDDDCSNGFLFDGFPRTLPQAEALKIANIYIDFVIEIAVEDAEIVRRMSGRRVHLTSGRTYHLEFNPPRSPGVDDITGEPLIQREDDSEATVRYRLEIYHSQTAPLVEYYRQWESTGDTKAPHYFRVDGAAPLRHVTREILNALAAQR